MATNNNINIIVKAVDNATKPIKDIGGAFSSLKLKINNSLGGINNITDGIQKSFGGLEDKIIGVGKAGAVALGGLGAYGLKTARDLEQTSTAFKVIIGDTAKAQTLLKELGDFAAKTPFEFPEIANAGKSLLAFGFDATQVKGALSNLGDIASGLNIPLKDLTDIYGKARTQGRLFSEDINQLTGRGIPIIKELAAQFNVSESRIKGMVENGQIGFPELEKAFQNMTAEGGQFNGMMDKQSQTLNGLLSTAKDNIMTLTRSLLGMSATGEIIKGGLFDKLKTGLGESLVWIEANKQKIKEFGDGIIALGGIVIGFVGNILNWILQNQELVKQIGELIAVLYTTSTVIGIVRESTLALNRAMLLLKANPVGLLFYRLIAAGTLLYMNWDKIKTKRGELGKSISETWNSIKLAIGEAINSIVIIVSEKFNILAQNTSDIFTKMGQTIKSFWDSFGTAIEVIVGTITGLYIPTMVSMAIASSVNAAKVIASWISMSAQATATGIIFVITEIPKIIASFIAMSVSAIVEGAKIIASWVAIGIRALKQSIQMGIAAASSVASWVTMSIGATINAAKIARAWVVAFGPIGWVSAAIVGLTILIAKNWDSIKLTLTNFGIWIAGFWDNFINLASIKLGEWGNTITNIRTSVKEGFISTISSMGDFIKQKIDSMVSAVSGAYDTVVGIYNKVKSTIGNITNAVSSAASSAASAVSSGVSSITGARALGGSVSSGKTYLVGEKGPELFTAPTTGNIIPNNKLSSGGNITINLGGVVVQKEADENRLVDKIKKALVNEAKLYNIGIS